MSELTKPDILLVDDNPENLQVLSLILARSGFKTRAATNGKQALRSIEMSPPMLVLLDILMPEMDGYETCKRIRESEKHKELPVIFISALGSMQDKIKAFEVGGVDYIEKPFNAIEVLARVTTHIDLYLAKLDLQRSNKELEGFAYVASHDLQEPLRVISSYVDLLANKYRDVLDEKGMLFIDRTMAAAGRMRNLINDLLEFSRIGNTEMMLKNVDFNELLDQVMEDLSVSIQNKNAEIINHGGHPSLNVDETRMHGVFLNLIGNALKYQEQGNQPVIEICSEVEGRMARFSIKDNGIGIPKDSHERIFQLFQRLHTRDEYEGTGIGLSKVKKSIERHGGKIWVDSEPGKGTTFHIALPIN